MTLLHYYSQNFKDGIQIRVRSTNKEGLAHFSQFISVTVKGILGKPQAQLREKLEKSKLKQIDDFFVKETCNV